MTAYEAYLEAERRLNEGLIRLDLSLERSDAKPRDPDGKMAEMRAFLGECGDPQRGIPAVHVAGTSGKGSVAAAVAGIFAEAGLKVGLHVSPYLQSATEKIWIGGRLVSAEDFAGLVDWVMPRALPRVRPEARASIHGMASVAVAFEAMRREKVDLLVCEAGCGGRYDLTSFVETRVGVITNVGLDHLGSLGPTLRDIAWHKAGIARRGAPLVTGARGDALGPIADESRKTGAPLIQVPSPGDPLAHNRALAIEASLQMAKQIGKPLSGEAIRRGIGLVRIPGRSEVVQEQGPRVVLDGAHNPDKISVAVEAALSGSAPRPRIAVIGFLGAKARDSLVRPLSGRFDLVIATEPRVYGKKPFPAKQAAALLSRIGYAPMVEEDPDAALDLALEKAGPGGTVIVTGSFYLVGELRSRWFPKERVVIERTSWPEGR